MGSGMTCPSCSAPLDDIQTISHVGVCPSCARSVVIDQGSVRVATQADIRTLAESELMQLRKRRPAAWRDETKARLTAIRGRAR